MIGLLALTAVLSAALIPHIDAIRPLHPALLFLMGAWALTLHHRGLGLAHIVALLTLAAFGTGAGYLVNLSAGIEPGLGVIWSWLPLAVLLASAATFSRLDVPGRALRRVLLVIAAGWCALIAVQVFAPLSPLSLAYVSEGRREQMEYLSHYLSMVMAPTGNPNNSAMLFALLIVTLVRLRPGPIGWPLIGGLIVGMALCYARTASVAFILALGWVFFSCPTRRKWTGIAATLALPLAIAAAVHWWPAIEAAAAAAAAFEDNSFAARTDKIWPTVLAVIDSQPLSILTGWGWYEEALFRRAGEGWVDSSLLFVLLSHGVLALAAIVAAAGWLWLRNPALRPALLMLGLCAITAAWVSDYRLNALVGAMIGVHIRPPTQPCKSASPRWRP